MRQVVIARAYRIVIAVIVVAVVVVVEVVVGHLRSLMFDRTTRVHVGWIHRNVVDLIRNHVHLRRMLLLLLLMLLLLHDAISSRIWRELSHGLTRHTQLIGRMQAIRAGKACTYSQRRHHVATILATVVRVHHVDVIRLAVASSISCVVGAVLV